MYFAGVDIGSTMTKVVIVNDGLRASVIGPTGPEHRLLAYQVMEDALRKASLAFEEITYIIATGYGRVNVPFADKQVTEISCHARGVASIFPQARTVIDIGGQDCKGIKLQEGRVREFVMNDKCAAGTGRFLEVLAEALGVRLGELGPLSLKAQRAVKVSSTCTVFAEQEIASYLAEGTPVEELIAGVHEAIAIRILAMVERIKVEREIVVTGGGAKNSGLLKALEQKLKAPLLVPPEPLITGALGAALLGREAALKAQATGQPLARKERKLERASLGP